MVVNPADVPTKDKERDGKRDRVDCRKLARGLCNGEINGIYACRQLYRKCNIFRRTVHGNRH